MNTILFCKLKDLFCIEQNKLNNCLKKSKNSKDILFYTTCNPCDYQQKYKNYEKLCVLVNLFENLPFTEMFADPVFPRVYCNGLFGAYTTQS